MASVVCAFLKLHGNESQWWNVKWMHCLGIKGMWWWCLVTKSCLTPCSPTDCTTPDFSVLHYLPELAHTHVHWVGDAIQPSQSPSPASPPALNLVQHQSLFQWVSSSHQVAKVLELHPLVIQQIPIAYLFYTWYCKFLLLSPYISPSSSPPTLSIGLFSMSVSPLLPWK